MPSAALGRQIIRCPQKREGADFSRAEAARSGTYIRKRVCVISQCLVFAPAVVLKLVGFGQILLS